MTEKHVSNPLEQFILLAKQTKGAATVELIKQVISAPGVYVFGELLDIPTILELEGGPNSNYLDLLKIFAYGTYNDYKTSQAALPTLQPEQMRKLRHLTIVSLAHANKDLIIEAIYADVIHGKLDQQNQRLEIDYALGRDVQTHQIGQIMGVLQDWCRVNESILTNVACQVIQANNDKEQERVKTQKMEEEISNLKKAIRAQQQSQRSGSQLSEADEAMMVDTFQQAKADSKKKSQQNVKVKGPRSRNMLELSAVRITMPSYANFIAAYNVHNTELMVSGGPFHKQTFVDGNETFVRFGVLPSSSFKEDYVIPLEESCTTFSRTKKGRKMKMR